MRHDAVTRRRPSRLGAPGVLALTILSVLIFAAPVLSVLIGSFMDRSDSGAGGWGVTAAMAALTDPVTHRALLNSVVLTVVSVALGMMIAVSLAWLSARSDAPLRRLITPTMIILFAVPHLYYAISWSLLGMSPSGSINEIFKLLPGVQGPVVDLISWAGLILVMAFKIAAIIYLLLLGPMGSVDTSLDEAARVAGAGRLRAFLQIELPVLAPALLSATVLAVVIALGILDIPLIMGTPAGIQTLSTQIYYLINTRVPADYAGANTVAILVMLCVAVPVVLQYFATRGKRFTTMTGKAFRRDRVALGGYRVLAAIWIALIVLIGLVLPMAQLVLGAVQPYAGVYTNLSFDNFEAVLSNQRVIDAFVRSFWFGAIAGLVATALALAIGIVALRSKSPLRKVPQGLVLLVLSVPGITIALGILSVIIATPFLHGLYGTVVIAIIGLTIAFTPIANRLTVGAIAQVGPELEEAARVAGASVVRATIGILVRLVLPTFFVSWFVVAVIVAGNLELPALLSSPGTEPITLVALQVSQQGAPGQASAIAILMLVAIGLGLGILTLLARGVKKFSDRRTSGAQFEKEEAK